MHLAPLIHDLAVILGVAGLISLLFHKIRQPVVLGYIIAGIVIGPHTPPFQLVTDTPNIQTLAELGVIFLMFTLGLEFSFRKLARVGGSAVVTAGMEVLFFLPVGYWVGRAFGWPTMDSVFLGAMLAISSTTIIIKALDELKLKKHRFAELIFAVLIVEDLFAILLLVGLGTMAGSEAFSWMAVASAALQLILVVGGWFLIGYFVIPGFMKAVGRTGNDEMLTILALGLCLALVVFAVHFGYSTALGAFIMGSILAESPVLPRIERNMESLRNLFGAIFFVSIGMLIDPAVLWNHRVEVAALCAVTIVGKILSTSFGALVSGQSIRNSVQVGFGLAQIGEFSFIIAQLGLSLKVTSDFLYPVAVAVSIVTTFTTPYLIRFSGAAAESFEKRLPPRLWFLLNRYAAHAEARMARGEESRGTWLPYFKWALNALTSAVIFVLCAKWLVPFLGGRIELSLKNVSLLVWLLAIVASSPFIWAMLTVFRRGPGASPVAAVLSQLAALTWIGVLSIELFPGKFIPIVTSASLLIAFAFFYRRLEASYLWFEKRFLATFEGKEEEQHGDAEDRFRHLVPWDAHLVRMEIHPNSSLVLRKISEAALRVRYGVNIVAIQRGRRAIVTPMPDEVLLPKDELILLATDAQVEKIRKDLEEPIESSRTPEPGLQYELRRLKVSGSAGIAGKSIRHSGLREKYRAMVVGIERQGRRTVNPDSDLMLSEDDVLWIAGEKERLDAAISALGESKP